MADTSIADLISYVEEAAWAATVGLLLGWGHRGIAISNRPRM
jgi:hypothetical protein